MTRFFLKFQRENRWNMTRNEKALRKKVRRGTATNSQSEAIAAEDQSACVILRSPIL
jgi:hypothetical protein